MKEWEYLENVTPLPQRLWRLLCTDASAVLRHPVKAWEETNYVPGTIGTSLIPAPGALLVPTPLPTHIMYRGRRYALEN